MHQERADVVDEVIHLLDSLYLIEIEDLLPAFLLVAAAFSRVVIGVR